MAEGEQDVPELPVDDRERLLRVEPEKIDASTVANRAIKQMNAEGNHETIARDRASIPENLATSRPIARTKAKTRGLQEHAAEKSKLWISDVWKWLKENGKHHASQPKWPR